MWKSSNTIVIIHGVEEQITIKIIKYFIVSANENMICQNVWNAANIGLTGKFMEEKNSQNKISKYLTKNLENISKLNLKNVKK